MFDVTELLTVLREQTHRRAERQQVTFPTLTVMVSAAVEQTLRSRADDLDAVSAVIGVRPCANMLVEPLVAASSSLVKNTSEAVMCATRTTASLLDRMVAACEK
jgi:hypothetical protein